MGFNPGVLDFVTECSQEFGLPGHSAILDVGTSELFCADDAQSLNRFLVFFGAQPYPETELARMANRGFAADLLIRAGFHYTAIDFADLPHTTRLDLNYDDLPAEHYERYDFVLNSGTSEHILNQYNVFKVMHQATQVGGLMYHGVPMAGEFEHGIFTYNPKFFWALAEANEYQLLRIWGWASSESHALAESMQAEIPFNNRLMAHDAYLHVLLRRTSGRAFRGLVDPAFK